MTTTSSEQKFARFLARGFGVIVDGLPRLLKPDRSSGLPLLHCGLLSNWPKDLSGWGGDATVFQRADNNEQRGQSVLPPVMEPRYSDGACLILLGLLSGPAAVAAHW
jgi:hypothetical protein